jgi:alpha-L-fucosidase
LIWFDTPKRMTREQSQSLVDFVHRMQPECLVNGRIGNGLGDYAEARDNVIPAEQVDADWETPATINDTWGFKVYDHNWKTPTDLIRKFVDIASKGGNYLLNVGPTADGVIPQASVERLHAMGDWLQVNGESVYGTRPGPLTGLDWCRTTAKHDVTYVHVFDWPAGGAVRIPSLGRWVRSVRLLHDGSNLAVRTDGDAVVVEGPSVAPDPTDSVIALS